MISCASWVLRGIVRYRRRNLLNAHRLRLAHAFGDAEDLLLAHDDVFLAVQLDLAARVLADEDVIADLHVEREPLALVVDAAAADGDHFGLERFFLRSVRDDDPADALFLLLDALDEDAIP